ncbi:hypothetical protein NM688_g579 [Phlebia brevispora]|uniref:Uncharacterized protein n=1 Tax=Phlebia brevispora TaxID=194682 RepID=A0ACC1TDP7_9APHY|nr:hypothetical protein NM688_g579 [Phlebia brevispora]
MRNSSLIFPPLPPHSAYHRLAVSAEAARAASAEPRPEASTSTSSVTVKTEEFASTTLLYPDDDEPPSEKNSPKLPSSSSSGSSSLTVPALTPNCSSSTVSSPPLTATTSLSSVDGDTASDAGPTTVVPGVDEDEVDRLTAQWLASPSTIEAFAGPSPKDASEQSMRKRYAKNSSFAFPQSPTPRSRLVASKPLSLKRSPSPDLVFPPPPPPRNRVRLITPPPQPRPCTPPRKRTTSSNSIQLSAQHTPISHRGLHMSPSSSASLAHYKSNLDPPPPAIFKPTTRAPLLLGLTDDPSLTLPSPELTKTPSRKKHSSPYNRRLGIAKQTRRVSVRAADTEEVVRLTV